MGLTPPERRENYMMNLKDMSADFRIDRVRYTCPKCDFYCEADKSADFGARREMIEHIIIQHRDFIKDISVD